MRSDGFADGLLRSFGLARLNVGDDGFVPPSPAGSPTTAACSTAGWLAMAPSTSAGYTLKPERMILLITSPTYLIGTAKFVNEVLSWQRVFAGARGVDTLILQITNF